MSKTVQNGDFEKSLAKGGGDQTPFFPHIVKGLFLSGNKFRDIYPKDPCQNPLFPAYSEGIFGNGKKLEIFIPKAPVKP
jgi:hypothetical protein